MNRSAGYDPADHPVVAAVCNALRECIDKPHDTARALPADFYTAPAFLDYEIDRLFHKQWVCLGRVEEVSKPGDYFTTDLVGEPLLVVRGEDHRVRVLANVCRHRGMPVAEGDGNSRGFRCPYHAWSYDLQGRLLRTPLLEPRSDFDPGQCRLPEITSTTWRGFIFANLDGNAPALEPTLQGLDAMVKNYHMEAMTLRYSRQEVWPTNWKCLTENFMEGYHLSTVHYQTLHPVTPTRLCEHYPAGSGYLGYFSHFPEDYPQRGCYHPDLSDRERGCSNMFAVMPGLVAGLAGHMVAYICIQPRTVDSVHAKLGMAFLDPEVGDKELNTAVDLFERTMAEDKVQLVNLMRGLKSTFYQPGPLAPPNYEGTVWDFYRYLARRLTL